MTEPVEAVQPRVVSVIIPTMTQAAHLARCLASLPLSSRHVSLETIVVLNGASPAVQAVAHGAPGVRVVDAGVNRGFAGGVRLGVSVAEGRDLVVLNDDVVVTPGWLDPLLETLDEKPQVAAVGPRVLATDGTVQEMGSVIWRDGSTRPIGRGQSADALRHRCRRRVDYASACALLVRRDAWDLVGGLDEGYHPAYYEDVDFCLALESHGLETWVDPRSTVVHAESASSNPSFKAYLFARHRARLVDRWHAALANRVEAPMAHADVAPAEAAALARLRPEGLRVLVVDDRTPQHGIGSGFDRMADTVIALAREGSHVRCVASELPPTFVPALAAAGVDVVDERADAVLPRELAAADVVLASRPNNADRVETVLRALPRALRPAYVYDAEALYHRRAERQAALAQGEAARTLLNQAAEWRRLERATATRADAIVCVSADEAAFFASCGASTVRVATPWTPDARLTSASLAGRADIGLVAGWLGGADSPNADGLHWFVTEVLPRVVAEVPWARLRVTGILPPALRAFEGLHLRAEGFIEDLASFYAALRVVVVPLRFGAGVKTKMIAAMQHGVPVVATSIGAEGLETFHGGALSVCDDAATFADAVVARLTDVRVWRAQRTAIEQSLSGVSTTFPWLDTLRAAAQD